MQNFFGVFLHFYFGIDTCSPPTVPPNISQTSRNGGRRTEPDGQEVSVTRNEQKNTQNRGGIRTNGQSFGGEVRSTTVGGNAGGVNINQAEQSRFESAQSEHFGSERLSRETTEREREKRTDTKAYYNAEHRNVTETAERRINHEYKRGRYNPAAANKKAKKQYYRKESLQERRANERKRNRGENDRKRKR